ncbi:MAG TPA: inorganic phosphate transporter [bacterium]|nr:inorganic phosphate transporter [bacterium]HPQ65737.1 inorganic phosphate transporter [bacterium]
MLSNFLFSQAGYKVFGGLYLGWGIGANNAANIFSTAVATNVLKYRTAVILIAIFVVLGATVEGPNLFLAESTKFSQESTSTLALVATLSAALTITVITYLSIPTSTSQAAIGAFMGIAIAASGMESVDWAKFLKMLICWLLHPMIGLVLAFVFLKILRYPLVVWIKKTTVRASLYKVLFFIFGCYGAYALGANNVVVTTVAYYNIGMFGAVGSKHAAWWAATLGGISIAVGALTYGAKVMVTIGKKITPLDSFSALVVVLVHSLTLHFFTQLNIPVSSSHAVVGAVIGVGLFKGSKMINRKTIVKIFIGWIATPLIAGFCAWSVAGLIR